MKSSIVPIILCVLTLSVVVCSILVFVDFDHDKLLGYLPILIAAYCTTSSLNRTYNMYVKHKESKQP